MSYLKLIYKCIPFHEINDFSIDTDPEGKIYLYHINTGETLGKGYTTYINKQKYSAAITVLTKNR